MKKLINQVSDFMRKNRTITAILVVLTFIVILVLFNLFSSTKEKQQLKRFDDIQFEIEETKKEDKPSEDTKIREEFTQTINIDQTIKLGNLTFSKPDFEDAKTLEQINDMLLDQKSEMMLFSTENNEIYVKNIKTGKVYYISDLSYAAYLNEEGTKVYYIEPTLDGSSTLMMYDLKEEKSEILEGIKSNETILAVSEWKRERLIILVYDQIQQKTYVRNVILKGKPTDYSPDVRNLNIQVPNGSKMVASNGKIFIVTQNGVSEFTGKALNVIFTWSNVGDLQQSVAYGNKVASLFYNKQNQSIILIGNQVITEFKQVMDIDFYDENHLLVLDFRNLYLFNIETKEKVLLSDLASDAFVIDKNIIIEQTVQIEQSGGYLYVLKRIK